MPALILHNEMVALRRREESSSSGLGCFVVLLVIGVVIYFVMRGRKDKGEQLGASHRPMGSGPVDGASFACPYPKCPGCGAPSDKMKSTWDGMRKVTWNCGYCGTVAGIQELKDEELPASARQRLGMDAPGMAPGQPGYYPPQQGGMGGVGGLLTGMMIGNMLGGGSHHHHHDGDSGSSGSSDSSNDSSGSDWGDSSSGGSDWGDSGGGDSGGGDSGGGGDW
jgi:hypothetical protein